MSKLSLNKTVILYDDTSRGEYAFLTNVIFKDKKSILGDVQLVDRITDDDKIILSKEKHRVLINVKTGVVSAEESFATFQNFYFATNEKAFLRDYVKKSGIKPPKMPHDVIQLPKVRNPVHE